VVLLVIGYRGVMMIVLNETLPTNSTPGIHRDGTPATRYGWPYRQLGWRDLERGRASRQHHNMARTPPITRRRSDAA
jgi:hypothetical protein